MENYILNKKGEKVLCLTNIVKFMKQSTDILPITGVVYTDCKLGTHSLLNLQYIKEIFILEIVCIISGTEKDFVGVKKIMVRDALKLILVDMEMDFKKMEIPPEYDTGN